MLRRSKYLLATMLSLLLFSWQISAQEEEEAGNRFIKRIISFTTETSLKLEVSFYKLPTRNESYSISIKGIPYNNTICDRAVKAEKVDGATDKLIFRIPHIDAETWTPATPNLYNLQFVMSRNGKAVEIMHQRIGFRNFESKNGNLYLNGKPIFLRGIAINPPGRGIPKAIEESREFAGDYVRFMKSIHVNIIRIPDNETWYDVCDELGMMVFGGNYAGSVDGQKPPKDYDKAVAWYENEKYAPISHHPSLMVYAMTNEVAFRGQLAEDWKKFLSYAHTELRKWDDTRAYIGNAGYGYGQSGDICDLHRYWGWYYCSPFNFLHIRNNADIIPFKKPVQPVTFTECVGNYTGPDGRYNLTPDHKNPGSQLNWTGHADERIQKRLADEHQSFTFKQATELNRRLRKINPELSGVFPFTILFYNWHTIEHFVDMDPKPVTQQARLSYQPILVSWECWTPNIYSGNTIHPIVHIVNDDDEFRDLTDAMLIVELQDKTRTAVWKDSMALPTVKYYDTYEKKWPVKVPDNLLMGNYRLVGKIIQHGKTISENFFDLFIGNRQDIDAVSKPAQRISLYDPSGKTATSLKKLDVSFKTISSFDNIPAGALLLIGENSADDRFVKQAASLRAFVAAGGRLLCLKQDAAHLPNLNAVLTGKIKNVTVKLDDPVYPPEPRPSRDGYYVNPERPEHPIFAGIEREQLRVWSDYTNWDESKSGFPAIYPITDGYVLQNKKDLDSTAVIGNYGVALESMAITETYTGKGNILLCAFDLAGRTEIDPVADRLLLNMIGYMSSEEGHVLHPMVTAPIVWGDYTSEKGLLTGVNSGLILNAKPVLTGLYSHERIILEKEGHMFGGQHGGFNTRPGVQYIPYGRRPFGPYSLRGFGNVPEPDTDNNNIGEGQFWCRIPAGKSVVSTKVWNPGTEAYTLEVRVNNKTVKQSIAAGATVTVDCPVQSTDLEVAFKGDRRLVLLETYFK
jgi:hypothetical protein